MAEGGRTRGARETNRTRGARNDVSFTNPYPWMSSIEAMVHLALEEHNVPFSWRYFNGESPQFQQLLGNQGYQPEFTLKDYRTVILITSEFWGVLPGVLDKVALATVTLQADGWTVVNLYGGEIRTTGAWNLLTKSIPNLGTIQGKPYVNPYGRPDTMSGLRNRVHTGGLRNPKLEEHRKNERRVVRRGHAGGGDGGRKRIGQSGAVTSRFKAR